MKHFGAGPQRVVLQKRIRIRVFNIRNDGSTLREFRAPAGQGYGAEAIDQLLEQIGADLERRFPQDDFGLVELGPAQFNFVWRGKRGASAPAGS